MNRSSPAVPGALLRAGLMAAALLQVSLMTIALLAGCSGVPAAPGAAPTSTTPTTTVAPVTPTVPASPTAPAAVRDVLAPTGTLRVAVYPGSPTSLVEQARPEQMRGVSIDLGRSLAARLGVAAQFGVYPRQAEAMGALQRGEMDLMITNATAERQRLVDFAPTLVDLELGVLVPAQSRVSAIDKLDQPGATVGVSQGGSSDRVLRERFKESKVRAFATLEAARDALQRGEIDAFATNKAILFELVQRIPGARMLEGRWGAEHLAPAIPKGRAAGMPYVQTFVSDVRANGELDRAAKRAGLRGTAAPE